MKKEVLILNPHFLPGFKSGGPQQTVKNICDIYSSRAEIYLITLNCDLGEKTPYDLPVNQWLERYNIKVKYVSIKEYNYKLFAEAYHQFHTIYTCGLFCSNTYHMMFIHRFSTEKNKTLYVAPMGVFSKNAIRSKGFKKQVFVKLCSIMGLFKKITWSFTSEDELKEARAVVGERNIRNYLVAEDLPRKTDFAKSRRNLSEKEKNQLNIVFLSRISPKKNLLQALQILNTHFEGKIQFDIYGVQEDIVYWRECEKKISELPDNIKVIYKGEVRPEKVIDVFSHYDVFLFPTKGENFGHVIYESLAGGCVPLISDTTPWKDFERKECGAVVPLHDEAGFREKIQNYILYSPDKFRQLKMNAVRYAEKKYESSADNSGYNMIFLEDEKL